jgi:OOP family OmpA-OmpF porin
MAARHRDDPRRYRRRILTVGAIALGLIFVIGAPLFVDQVEDDLEQRVPDELAEAGFDGVAASFDGQDGTLTCDEPLANPEGARQAAYDIWGVRSIDLDRSCRVNADPTADDADVAPTDAASATTVVEPTTPVDTTDVTPSSTEPEPAPAFDTVQAALSGSPQLSLFAVLTQEAGLAIEFGDPSASPVTVFAPTDDAFEALPADVLADLRADPDALRDVLLHHSSDGHLLVADFESGPIEMRDGATVELDADEPSIDGAVITVSDIEATTGVVHIVDSVLVPDQLDLTESPRAASVSASYDAGSIELSGVVSTEAVRATLRTAAAADGVEVADLMSVDPETGLDATTAGDLAVLVEAMREHLLNGMAGFDGRSLFLTGTYSNEQARAAAVAVAESVGVEADLNEPPEATEDDAVDLEAELNDFVATNPILFEPSSATISPESTVVIDQLAQLAQQFEGISITVQGHTDSDGDPQENQVLSEARAFAVQQALIERGLPAASVRFQGFGSSQPVLVDGVEDKEASRRVEFAVEATS